MLKSPSLRSIAVAIFLCLVQIAFAQTKVTVNGTVKDAKGQPVVGAFVLEKGTLNGAVTDADGKWSLSVPAGAVVTIENLGYTTVEFKADKAGTHDLTMEEDVLALDDVLVVGYSSATKRDLISSVSTVKTQQISNLPVVNISQGLAGRSPGLIVQQSGGGVNVNPSISIRGGGEPLYVIDGAIRSKTDFVSLSPEDIEQMNILKDASATAVYGSRAANGIIQIVTRRGTQGKVAVDYDFNQSFAQPAFWPDVEPTWKRYEFSNQGYTNDGLEPAYSKEVIELAKQGMDSQRRPMDSQRDLIIRDWVPQTKHTVRVSGGNDVMRTYASFSNTDQKSMLKNADHRFYRSTIRLAETVNLKKFGVQINATVDGYTQSTHEPRGTQYGGPGSSFSGLARGDEGVIFNAHGLPWWNGNYNHYAQTTMDAGYSKWSTNVINAKGEIVWSVPWVKGLKARVSSNYRYYFYNHKLWQKNAAEYEWDSTQPIYAGQPQLTLTNDKNIGYTHQAFLEYANQFGKHSISAVGGYEQYYETGYDYYMARTNYEFQVDQISVGPASTQTNGGSESELGRAAWIGQARYNYANKYYLEGSMRYDGSDYFAPGKRWGLFVGGSVGWVVTAEPWMKSLVDNNVLNMLKLRGSYGQTGLDSSAGRFAYMQSYTLSATSYVVDGEFASGFSEGALPSPDLTWYTTNQTDIGFDFASLSNRLYGSFDYFFYKTFGYLMAPTGQSYLNQVMGISMPKVKSESEFRREGIEIQLGWRDNVGDFSYDIAANMTYFDQLWAYNQSEAESSYMNPYTRTQQQRGYYGNRYHCLGFYTSEQDVFNSVGYLSSMNTGNLAPGDLKYEDTNGDGQITSADYRRLGKTSVPRAQYGLSINLGWRGFYFSTLIQGATNYNLGLNGTNYTNSMQTSQVGDLSVIFPYQENTWSPSNTNAAYPRLTSNTNLNNNNNFIDSDFWLINCAYVRMKDFQFGYDFKYSALKKYDWLSRLRVGISGQNILTWSNSQIYGLDPEAGSSQNYNYPVDRTLALTVNIGF